MDFAAIGTLLSFLAFLVREIPFWETVLLKVKIGCSPFLPHARSPSKHSFNINKLASIPMLFKKAPTALYGIIFTRARRIVKSLNPSVNPVNKFHHPFLELSSYSATFGTVINFNLY